VLRPRHNQLDHPCVKSPKMRQFLTGPPTHLFLVYLTFTKHHPCSLAISDLTWDVDQNHDVSLSYWLLNLAGVLNANTMTGHVCHIEERSNACVVD
jgi:hypothetical protein